MIERLTRTQYPARARAHSHRYIQDVWINCGMAGSTYAIPMLAKDTFARADA
jgi:hypothetical protein